MIERYDKNNKEHNDMSKYEVVEWENVELDGRHPIGVMCGDFESDAQRR